MAILDEFSAIIENKMGKQGRLRQQRQQDFLQLLDQVKQEKEQNFGLQKEHSKQDYLADLALREETSAREEKLRKTRTKSEFEQQLQQAKQTTQQQVELKHEAADKLKDFLKKETVEESISEARTKPLGRAEKEWTDILPPVTLPAWEKRIKAMGKDIYRKFSKEWGAYEDKKLGKMVVKGKDGKLYEVVEIDKKTGEPLVIDKPLEKE